MSPTRHRVEFEALGTYVHLQTAGDPERARRRSAEILDAVDRACSRFRRDSDLSRVNASPGQWISVSDLFVAALRVGLAAAGQTDGILDPCLGRSLVELGYDVDFAQVRDRAEPRYVGAVRPRPGAWKDVEIDRLSVRIPAGVALDLGATAKAWASDLVALHLVEEFGAPVLVSLGGDLRIAAPDDIATTEEPWPIEVTEHPGGRDDTIAPAEIWLGGGGLATSSTRVRRWRSGGVEQHHLVDPRTGTPARGPWRTATATGPTCLAANVAATAAIVLGDAAVPWLEDAGVSARLVGQDGTTHHLGGWPRATAPAVLGETCSRH